jgi:uncharacterized membrane protein
MRGTAIRTVRAGLAHLARLRFAPLYVSIVVTVAVVLDRAVGTDARAALVLANSTNVANLEHYRLWTLVTSAFLTDGPPRAGATVQLLLLAAVAELMWGWRRLLAVFFLTNAVASSLVYGLLRVGVRRHWFDAARPTRRVAAAPVNR